MNVKRFEDIQSRLLFVLAETNRHRTRTSRAGGLDAAAVDIVLIATELTACDALQLLFDSAQFDPKNLKDATPRTRPFADFESHAKAVAAELSRPELSVQGELLTRAEMLAGVCVLSLVQQFPLHKGVSLSSEGVIRAVFCNHPWYGFGPVSWHQNEGEANYNAAVVDGKVATVYRDDDGHYAVPMEERLSLGVTSSAW